MIKLVGITFEQFLKNNNLEHWNEVEVCRGCGILLDQVEFGETKDFIMVEWKASKEHLNTCKPGHCMIKFLPKDQTLLREAFEEIK